MAIIKSKFKSKKHSRQNKSNKNSNSNMHSKSNKHSTNVSIKKRTMKNGEIKKQKKTMKNGYMKGGGGGDHRKKSSKTHTTEELKHPLTTLPHSKKFSSMQAYNKEASVFKTTITQIRDNEKKEKENAQAKSTKYNKLGLLSKLFKKKPKKFVQNSYSIADYSNHNVTNFLKQHFPKDPYTLKRKYGNIQEIPPFKPNPNPKPIVYTPVFFEPKPSIKYPPPYNILDTQPPVYNTVYSNALPQRNKFNNLNNTYAEAVNNGPNIPNKNIYAQFLPKYPKHNINNEINIDTPNNTHILPKYTTEEDNAFKNYMSNTSNPKYMAYGNMPQYNPPGYEPKPGSSGYYTNIETNLPTNVTYANPNIGSSNQNKILKYIKTKEEEEKITKNLEKKGYGHLNLNNLNNLNQKTFVETEF